MRWMQPPGALFAAALLWTDTNLKQKDDTKIETASHLELARRVSYRLWSPEKYRSDVTALR